MTAPPPGPARVRVDGKFFRLGTERFHVRGLTYGGFSPNRAGEPFPEAAQVARDFALARSAQANTIRVYDLPPAWLLDLAREAELKVLAGIAWPSHTCFLDSRATAREIRNTVVEAVQRLAGHPALLGLSLANEIPADVVRWLGAGRVADFLDDLAIAARQVDPGCLCTYGNFPTTGFLQPRQLDFVTFNVFLHEPKTLANYLSHLQCLADSRPLLLGECGADSLREGADRQAMLIAQSIDASRRAGLAGTIVFSLTDDWFRGGRQVSDWAMGITTADRSPKPALAAVRTEFATPAPLPPKTPKVSVVVASYNAAHTLRPCLESLRHLDYPDYEVLLIDDGSTDDTTRLSSEFPEVRTLRHPRNLGLSTARNLGIRAATGDVIAFTDADCRVDRDWLRWLVLGLFDLQTAGIGGPNLLPPDDSPVAAAVMASPGGPAHVLLDSRFAEHLPGCNMAFWRWALEAIGGFDPVFQRAGDDVDVCWRILRQGWRLGFAPAGFVWHHRRSTIRDYLRQQAGYGEAEALLLAKHPERFNAIGGAQWEGRICSPAPTLLPWHRPAIYRGVFATAPFQRLYTPAADGLLPILTSLEYHLVVALPVLVVSVLLPALWPLAAASLLTPPVLCILASLRAPLPPDRTRWWSRPLVAVLHHLQPLVRGAARYEARFNRQGEEPRGSDTTPPPAHPHRPPGIAAYWAPEVRERGEWIRGIVAALDRRSWAHREDAGWSDFDLQIFGSPWVSLTLVTALEIHADASCSLRARIRRRWTLTAAVGFWGALVLVALIAGIFQVDWRAWWIPVASQSVIAGLLQHHGRRLQQHLVGLLDEVAKDHGLVPIPPQSG